MKKKTIKIKNKRYELVFNGIDQWPSLSDDDDYAESGYINVDIKVGGESFGVSGGWLEVRSGDFIHYQTNEEGGINCHGQLNKFAKAIGYKLDKEELESQWWYWHDADSSRWYDSEEAAKKACKSWVSGKSEIGPEYKRIDFSSLGELIAEQATPIIAKYIDENCPAIRELHEYQKNNDGCYMCLNRGNDGYHLYIWDKKKDSVNDDGQKASDGGFISCTTIREMDLLSEYETSGDVVKI